MSFDEFGFGDNDSHAQATSNRFKGKTDQHYRVSFGWWELDSKGNLNIDATTPRFVSARRLYAENVGYFLDRGPEFQSFAKGPSKLTIGSIIVEWPVDDDDPEVNINKLLKGKFSVLPWTFSQDKYRELARRHARKPFNNHDLLIHCTDAQYQKMTFDTADECMLREVFESKDKKLVAVKNQLIQQIKGAADRIQGSLAQDLTVDQIRQRLGDTPGVLDAEDMTSDDIDSALMDALG